MNSLILTTVLSDYRGISLLVTTSRTHHGTPTPWTKTAKHSSWWMMGALATGEERELFVPVWKTTFPISALVLEVRQRDMQDVNKNFKQRLIFV